MVRIITALLVGLGAQGVAADCSAMLSATSPAIDYEVSDLEGLYLDLLEKVQKLPEAEPSRIEYLLKEILNMKASFLNDAGLLVQQVLTTVPDSQRKNALLADMYQMIASLGVPPKNYGLILNRKGMIQMPKVDIASKPLRPIKYKNPIGFILNDRTPDPLVPEGFHRSIGFGPQTIEGSARPARRGGNLFWEVSEKHPDMLLVFDGEKELLYVVPKNVMVSAAAAFDGRAFILDFSIEGGGWIVRTEKLDGTEERIGFL